ncbi:hypothetical protein M2418_002861 [Rhizobium sp. BIGb0125]|uniref:hypothetical protein n=1 Tax=Rhizobium sp. BIGb0125 TaxID=2940618 RepID=UPI0021673B3D|nr:hypothetical protein [Rhizobium sp. BIGb0125]MCS4243330.1 hypothetical protein [Rhizobium sp. BIGb0125]
MAQMTVGAATTNEDYLNRRAEQLVIEGYRFLAGLADSRAKLTSPSVLRLYHDNLGEPAGAEAAVALERLVAALKTFRASPIAAYPPGSRFISPDEVLVLGIIAGIQHWDEQIFRACLKQLCAESDRIRVAASAETFAMALHNAGMILAPLPFSLRARIVRQSEIRRQKVPASITLH